MLELQLVEPLNCGVKRVIVSKIECCSFTSFECLHSTPCIFNIFLRDYFLSFRNTECIVVRLTILLNLFDTIIGIFVSSIVVAFFTNSCKFFIFKLFKSFSIFLVEGIQNLCNLLQGVRQSWVINYNELLSKLLFRACNKSVHHTSKSE